jgi:quinoprotein glucose dehydrogenase
MSSRRKHAITLLWTLLGFAGTTAHAQPASPFVKDGEPRTISVWAKKGLMQSPVAICLDWKGNLYVAESERAGNAVNDTRNLGQLNAVEEDLVLKSVEDRRAQINRWTAQGAFEKDFFTKTEDRVRLVRDTDGDGVADKSSVYAGGFNDALDGIGAGVLWVPDTSKASGGGGGSIYYTCIPNLWKLPAREDGLAAASRESLSSGYGIRWCFFGHDLHGLVMGPEGRLYFSMGDRGYNVRTKEGVDLVGVDRGAVFRCWPDGSGLELFHDGLRNPQCLAFNEYGDLFTGDNNCDSGDRARFVHVAEQADSGWRQDVQSLPSRGPWNREHIWQTLEAVPGPTASGGFGAGERPACFLPPISYMGDGPSGLRAYPGTGESKAYDGHLFLVDFYGSGAKIHAVLPGPKGAGFALKNHVEYYKGVTVTDIAWGYDGRLYMADWGGGWSPNLNGEVLVSKNDRVHADTNEATAIAEVKSLFATGFAGRGVDELVALMGHRDSRVRLSAQHELASRDPGATSPAVAATAANTASPRLKRIHAIWCIGQFARRQPDIAQSLLTLVRDADAEVRTQIIKTLGDLRLGTDASTAAFVAALGDESSRVQHEASIALGKSKSPTGTRALTALLERADDRDPTLRNAAAYALSQTLVPKDLAQLGKAGPPAVRLAAVLALRRQSSEELGAFLADTDPAVAAEAARAVYDLRLKGSLPRLAAMLAEPAPRLATLAFDGFLRRAIEANVLLGGDDNAKTLLAFASRTDIAAEWRGLALERLQGWDAPLKREGVWGNWVDLPGRPASAVESVVRDGIAALLASAEGDLLARAQKLEARYTLPENDLIARLHDDKRNSDERLTLLDELARRSPARVAEACERVLRGPTTGDGPTIAQGLLRARAESLWVKADPPAASAYLAEAINRGGLQDRQRSVTLLGGLAAEPARAAVRQLAEQLATGTLDDDGLSLDIYEAAMAAAPETRALVETIGKAGNRPAGFATSLLRTGGDAARGREVFFHHGAAECLRCHTVVDQGNLVGIGGNAGPNLSDVGSRSPLSKLVESIVDPGATVTPGYGLVSAMPTMTTILKPREARDVVAYLATLKTPAPKLITTVSAQAESRPLEAWLLWPAIGLVGLAVWPAIRGRRS